MSDAAFTNKSTPAEIRARFDNDVERFSNLETGQAAQSDAPLHMEMVTQAAVAVTPRAQHILDLGCGAGNYTLKLLAAAKAAETSGIDSITLVDLSRPMLDRAIGRITAVFHRDVHAVQSDIRDFDFGKQRYDIVMAAQCLHHLRADAEWEAVFANVYRSLRPGGGFWIADSLEHELAVVEQLIRQRWGDYLESLKGAVYREHVFAYVEKEDTPRPLHWQLDLLRRVGFTGVDVLHKHDRFASFGAVKS